VRAGRLVLALALLSLLGGCAATKPRPSAALLERADRLVEKGQYTAAIGTYDELLATYPKEPEAARAQAVRDTLSSLIAARADVVRLKEELATRDGEVGRLKQELHEVGRLKQELHRLATETERLRADLEELKRIDLKQERRRR
jgi:hypothetical protein